MNGAPFDPDACLLEEDADDVLLGLLARDNEPLPWHAPYRRPPSREEVQAKCAFDKAELLRHMQDLIARRQVEVQEVFARERAALDQIIGDADKPKPPPQPKPWPHPKVAEFIAAHTKPKAPSNVEPWFDLARTPTLSDMRCIAQYALGYFRAARGLGQGMADGGSQMAEAICPRDADMIAVAMQRWAKEIPPAARFSVRGIAVPDGVLGVCVSSPSLAMQAVSLEDGQKVSLAVKYDV